MFWHLVFWHRNSPKFMRRVEVKDLCPRSLKYAYNVPETFFIYISIAWKFRIGMGLTKCKKNRQEEALKIPVFVVPAKTGTQIERTRLSALGALGSSAHDRRSSMTPKPS